MIARRALFGRGVLVAMGLAGARARAATRHRPAPARLAAAPLPLVLLDPGHGGKDPGAIGVSGTFEKHIAFAAAEELRRQLLAARLCRVELTRAEDVFIPLQQRVEIAHRLGAVLFVSMHADALLDRSVRGASVYTLGAVATDAQTAALAQRENSADRYAGVPQAPVSPEVARILASLVRQETRSGSARLAHAVVDAFGHDVGLLRNPSRQAGFAVLQSADIASVLVEMGFMSNPQDEAALRQADHRARIAAALKRAVQAWLAGWSGHRAGSGTAASL